jgi:hypothetical protein
MRSVLFLLVCSLLLAPPVVCFAQDLPSQDALNRRHQELLEWLEQYRDWEAWMVKWGNKVAYTAAGGIRKTRPTRPDPPEWLWNDCETLLEAEGQLGEACRVLKNWESLNQLILTRKDRGGSTRTDIATKSSFLQRVHLSAGWVPAQVPAPKVYLVAGMQVGIVEVGRATLPAVGVGMLAMANAYGGWDWKPATVIGIGYRLSSFPFPGVKREAHLHINLARVNIHGVDHALSELDPGQNLVGFSLTFSKAR